jgi:hypothetical protein
MRFDGLIHLIVCRNFSKNKYQLGTFNFIFNFSKAATSTLEHTISHAHAVVAKIGKCLIAFPVNLCKNAAHIVYHRNFFSFKNFLN